MKCKEETLVYLNEEAEKRVSMCLLKGQRFVIPEPVREEPIFVNKAGERIKISVKG